MENQNLKQFVRALGAGVMTMLTALLIFDTPPDNWANALWQPSLQGGIVFLAALGINRVTQYPQ